MLNHSANVSIIKCRKSSCQDITCKLDKGKHSPQCLMQARSLTVSVFLTEVWDISEEGERAGLAVCSLLCKGTYCLELEAAWSWAWSTGCAAEQSPRRRGSSHGCAVHYLQGKMKRQRNKSVMRGADGGSGCHTDLCTLQVSGRLLLILWGNFMWSELSLNPSVCRVPPTPDPVTFLRGS